MVLSIKWSLGKTWLIQRYCVVSNKCGITKISYSLNYRESFLGLTKYVDTKKYLSGVLKKKETSVKQFLKYDMKLRKEKNYLKNQNTDLLKMANKISSHKYLHTINKNKVT